MAIERNESLKDIACGLCGHHICMSQDAVVQKKTRDDCDVLNKALHKIKKVLEVWLYKRIETLIEEGYLQPLNESEDK